MGSTKAFSTPSHSEDLILIRLNPPPLSDAQPGGQGCPLYIAVYTHPDVLQ